MCIIFNWLSCCKWMLFTLSAASLQTFTVLSCSAWVRRLSTISEGIRSPPGKYEEVMNPPAGPEVIVMGSGLVGGACVCLGTVYERGHKMVVVVVVTIMDLKVKLIDSYKLFHLYSHIPVPLKIQESLFTIVARWKYMQFYMRQVQRLSLRKMFFSFLYEKGMLQ